MFVFRIGFNFRSLFCQINFNFRIDPINCRLILINGSVFALFELNLYIVCWNDRLIFARSLWNDIFCKVVLSYKSRILIVFCLCSKCRIPSVVASFLFVIVYTSYCRCSDFYFLVGVDVEFFCICCCSLAVQVKLNCYISIWLVWWITWVWYRNYIFAICVLGSVSCICSNNSFCLKFRIPFLISNCKSCLGLDSWFC